VGIWGRRWLPWLVLALTGIAAALPGIRDPALRSAGHALVVDEPVQPVDIIVLAVWAGRSGAIDAADLVHAGIASRVAVLPEPPLPAEDELVRRGVHFQNPAADRVELLHALGVDRVEVIPEAADGTEAEGPLLAAWCDRQQFRSVIVVSAPDHSRRVRRVLRRSMSGHQTRVLIRSARFAAFDPDRWWQSRNGVRTGIAELQKLLFDIARHPFS